MQSGANLIDRPSSSDAFLATGSRLNLDAQRIPYPAILHGHVVVDPHHYTLPFYIDIADGLLIHYQIIVGKS
jgi:hypothetical protein